MIVYLRPARDPPGYHPMTVCQPLLPYGLGALRGALLGALLVACGSDATAPAPDKPAPPDARVIGPDPVPLPVGDLPVECGMYKAMVQRLARCETLGPQRGLLEQQFETSWKAWSLLPRNERANVVAGCRAAADALRAAAAGPCGW